MCTVQDVSGTLFSYCTVYTKNFLSIYTVPYVQYMHSSTQSLLSHGVQQELRRRQSGANVCTLWYYCKFQGCVEEKNYRNRRLSVLIFFADANGSLLYSITNQTMTSREDLLQLSISAHILPTYRDQDNSCIADSHFICASFSSG